MGIRKKPVESNMYYCKSRYYVPEWCRWLNADSISFLNLQNIHELNLFADAFGAADLGGKVGLFNKLGNFFTPSDFFLKYGGMNIFRGIVWGSIVLVGETISRTIMVRAPAALLRFIIDLLFFGV